VYEQDFIKRLIRQFTQAILQVVGLTHDGRLTEAATLIEESYDELFGLSSTVVYHSPPDELIQLVARGDDDDPRRIFILAELLRREAEISQARHQDFDTHMRLLKSLALHLEAARLSPGLEPEATLDAILQLQHAIREGGMPAEVQADLFFFFEDQGHFRHALDAITAYLSRADRPEDVRPHLEAFCRRMLELPESALAAGGLSRAEVQAALSGTPRRG
jgi:hypothetical protein